MGSCTSHLVFEYSRRGKIENPPVCCGTETRMGFDELEVRNGNGQIGTESARVIPSLKCTSGSLSGIRKIISPCHRFIGFPVHAQRTRCPSSVEVSETPSRPGDNAGDDEGRVAVTDVDPSFIERPRTVTWQSWRHRRSEAILGRITGRDSMMEDQVTGSRRLFGFSSIRVLHVWICAPAVEVGSSASRIDRTSVLLGRS